MSGTILSLLMLAGLVLIGGGIYLLAKRKDRRRGALMIAAGAVMLGNVVIWAVPIT
jgi:LPXTG-motif cell wall-anchored protein